MRALIVDDEASARSRLARQLQACPQITIEAEAENGLAALNQIVSLEPDLVFLDIEMPGMNGFELAQQAAAIRPDLKIILSSGYIAPEMAKAMSSVWTTVPKPWRRAQLAQTIAEVLGVSSS